MKQIATGLNAEFATMSCTMAMDELVEFVRSRGERSYLKPFALTTAVREEIDDLNTKGKSVNRPWVYSHLEAGFTGAFYEPKTPDCIAEPVMTFDESIRLWALNKFALKTMTQAMKASRI